MAKTALAAGATRVAAELPALLEDSNSLPAAFSGAARAWRDVLRGTSGDLSDCGASTLDEWGAELLARLLGDPRRAPELRRTLRQEGVAAFGMRQAA